MKGRRMVQMADEVVNQGRREVANEIAEALGETATGPQILIRRLVFRLGSEVSREYLQRALSIEQSGGMMNVQGTKRRTVGGIFFYLMKAEHAQETTSIFGARRVRPKSVETERDASLPRREVPSPMTWDERLAVLASIEKRGNVSAKITLSGRVQPEDIRDQHSCVVVSMESMSIPSIPKGVPVPPPAPTNYTIYISHKLWKRVAQAIADPEDNLIIDGYPRLDMETQSIAIIATNVSSRKLKSAGRLK